MDRQLIWSDAATDDLESTAAYISRDSPAYAASFVRRVLAAAKSVQHMPESGGIVPEFDRQDLREVLVGNYRIVYSLGLSEVRIVAIVHGARELRQIFDSGR
ncbi:MAG: type II toxin-antitoxin system RelE/ParE family toxin [Planctomycetales bacterium]|jgi:toxin ParE1/3/4